LGNMRGIRERASGRPQPLDPLPSPHHKRLAGDFKSVYTRSVRLASSIKHSSPLIYYKKHLSSPHIKKPLTPC